MHRIVHFDLKGAPLKIPYLEKVLQQIKEWGATGILLEWEDTFPYTGDLVCVGSMGGCGGDGMYTVDEVRHIIRYATELGLEVIQLIQTIGHLEFCLKHPSLSPFREARSASALCPIRGGSLPVELTRQALALQPGAKYLHIGADEVWHTGVCESCKKWLTENQASVPTLFLNHIRNLALHLKKEYSGLKLLIWDDMLRSVGVEMLKASGLGDLVEPVLWDYNTKEHFRINPNLWDMYRQVFPTVWAGSAYKGANGSCQLVSPVSRYVSNHAAWTDEIRRLGGTLHFSGIILTGWSRYSHYASLCELMPVSLPSLAACLQVVQGCERNAFPESFPENQICARSVMAVQDVRTRAYALLRGDDVTTWLGPWAQRRRYTDPTQIEGIAHNARLLHIELTVLRQEATTQLHTITGPRSVEEFIDTYMTQLVNEMAELCKVAEERFQEDASVKPV